ncbi:MAG: hypothetical protein HOW73_14390 [Polyangiaceae bacterium]|nr:hypothetical protein [Polyangiaceae bacterium]
MTAGAGDPRLALRESVVRLLRASRREELASIVARGEVELCPTTEAWQIGERSVLAQRIGLLVDAEDYVELHREARAVDLVRASFAIAVRSFETELLDLALFVRLPAPTREASWGRAYRSAPAVSPEEPTPGRVHAAVVALATAYGRIEAAEILERGELEVAPIADATGSLRKWVVLLDPPDFVRAERDTQLTSQIESMVRAAAAGATVQIGEVSLAVRR